VRTLIIIFQVRQQNMSEGAALRNQQTWVKAISRRIEPISPSHIHFATGRRGDVVGSRIAHDSKSSAEDIAIGPIQRFRGSIVGGPVPQPERLR